MKNVSIIIPTYNCEKYIEKCLISIFNQDYKEYEIILVNDGSTDNTINEVKKVIKGYSNINIKIINKENGGPSSARNIGIKNASFNYICFIDSDDEIEKNYLNSLVKEEADLVMMGFTDKYKNKIKRIIPLNSGYYNDSTTILKNVICNLNNQVYNSPHSKLYKLSIIKKYNILFDENMKMGEDLKFNLEYLKKCNNIKVINDTSYIYINQNPDALTNSFNTDRWDIEKYLYNLLNDFTVETDNNSLYINEFLLISVNKIFMTLINTKINYKDKRIYLKKIFNDNIFKNKKYKISKIKNLLTYICLKLKMIDILYFIHFINLKIKEK